MDEQLLRGRDIFFHVTSPDLNYQEYRWIKSKRKIGKKKRWVWVKVLTNEGLAVKILSHELQKEIDNDIIKSLKGMI